MNIVQSYINKSYEVDEQEFLIILVEKNDEDNSVWYNNYVGELFVCYNNKYNSLIYEVINNNHIFFESRCYIPIKGKDGYAKNNVGTIITGFNSKRPLNWDDYLDYIDMEKAL